LGFVLAFFAVCLGFGMVWHIWWLAGGSLACGAVALLRHSWMAPAEVHLPPQQAAAGAL
jgi:cytochrome o ubiquinol oxidase subunit 1